MPTDASVLRKMDVGCESVICTVCSSVASARSIYVRSTAPCAALAVSSVKATSCAVTGVPSVKLASSRSVNVQTSASSERE